MDDPTVGYRAWEILKESLATGPISQSKAAVGFPGTAR